MKVERIDWDGRDAAGARRGGCARWRRRSPR